MKLQRGRCLDRSEPATAVEISALGVVAGFHSWIVRHCRSRRSRERFHIARINLTSNRERLVGRELVSESTPTNRRKWAIPPRCTRTASVSDAAVDLDRPDGSTQEDFWLGSLRQKLHSNGTAPLSPMAWSFFQVKRSVSASLAGGDVFMMREGMAGM